VTTKTKPAFHYAIPDNKKERLGNGQGIEDAANAAIAELDELIDNPDATPAHVVAWFAKWKTSATYKHLGLAISQFVRERDIRLLEK
jgi:hypothetical protein